MVAKKVLLGLFLCLLGTTSVLATTRSPRLGGGPKLCNLERLHPAKSAQRFEFEGGSIDTWDETDDQFQCVGVAPVSFTMKPNSLALPSFHPFVRLVYIAKGQGIFGLHFPGCPETFDTGLQGLQQSSRRMRFQGQVTQDSHQKLLRFKQGDILAFPAGLVHWGYNDGTEDVVTIAINDLNNPLNQLDMQSRTFVLAGGITSQHIQGQPQENLTLKNIFAGLGTEVLAESFNADPEIIKAMQESLERGLIVNVPQPMQFVTAEEDQQQQPPRQRGQQGGGALNGFEEKICSSEILYSFDNQREADYFSREAGKLNLVNEHKLPILSYLDLSAEKGYLQPNALLSPNWPINSHTIINVLRGDAQVQIASNTGETVMDEQVNQGDYFVVPQLFASTLRAGQNGFEWVAFKTSKSAMTSPLAGYTSVLRGMPLEVLTNAYQISPSQAQSLKTNRGAESILLSPQKTSQQSS